MPRVPRKSAKGAKEKLRSSIAVASTSPSLGSHIPAGKKPHFCSDFEGGRCDSQSWEVVLPKAASSPGMCWKTPWNGGGLKFLWEKLEGSEVSGRSFCCCILAIKLSVKGEILFYLTTPVKSIFMDLGLEMLKCIKKGRFMGFAVLAFPYRHSLKVVPSQGVILLSSLKSCLPSGRNPRIYGSNPLQTRKSSGSQGFYSHGFMGIGTQELQNRSKAPDPALLGLPVPFSHSSCALSQGEGILHPGQSTAPCSSIFSQVCASETQF